MRPPWPNGSLKTRNISGNLLWTFHLHRFASSWNYQWSNGSTKHHRRRYSQKEILSNSQNCSFTQFRLYILYKVFCLYFHSSEIRSLCLVECSSETLQNFPYFWNTETYIGFFISCYFIFPLMNALVYVYMIH